MIRRAVSTLDPVPDPAPSPGRARVRRAGRAGAAAVLGAALLLAGTPAGAAAAAPGAALGALATGARPELPAPVLVGPVQPDEERQPVVKDVVLAWRAVPGATGYRVQLSQDGEFADDAVTLDVTTAATRLAVPGWLPQTAYRWRVAATQPVGHGHWSASGAFTKGWRERPTGLVADVGGSGTEVPTLSWLPLAGASEYEVQVSASPLFDRDPVQGQAGYGTSSCFTVRTRVTGFTGQASARNDAAGDCDFSKLVAHAPRYWRVRGLDHVVGKEPQVDTTPVVDDGISYLPPAGKPGELDTDPCPVPKTAEEEAAPEEAASELSCEPDHVVAKSGWSAVQSVLWAPVPADPVTDDTYAPVAARPVGAGLCRPRAGDPDDGVQHDCLEFPTLDWEPRSGATSYRLYVALDEAFANIHEIVETPATEWTPTAAWRDTTAVQSYYYAVQACTSERCGAVSSTPASLRKKGPRTVVTAPADGALLGAADVQFRWRPFSATQAAALASRVPGTPAVSEAHAYRLQVAPAPADGRPASDADFQDPVDDVVVDGSACRPGAPLAAPVVEPRATTRAVQSCAVAGGVAAADARLDEVVHVPADRQYPSGTYVWRVQALDASSHRLSWSTPRTFRRDVTAPTATVTSGSRVAVGAPLVVRFSEPVHGVSEDTVQVTPADGSWLGVSDDRREAVLFPGTTWTPGRTYTVRLRPGLTDEAGNPLAARSAALRIDPRVDDGSRALAYTGRWTRRAASNAVGGGFRRTAPRPGTTSSARATVHGAGVLVTGCVGPASGLADVLVGGVRKARIDTYRAHSACGVPLARLALPRGEHRVEVRALGRARAASRGTAVGLDALTAL